MNGSNPEKVENPENAGIMTSPHIHSSKNVDSENVKLMLEQNSTVVTVHDCKTSRSLPGIIESPKDVGF